MEFKESDRLLLRWSAHPSFLPECILYLFDRSSCNVLNIDIAEVFLCFNITEARILSILIFITSPKIFWYASQKYSFLPCYKNYIQKFDNMCVETKKRQPKISFDLPPPLAHRFNLHLNFDSN